jgi:Ankyrin repeats (3 copies)
MDLLTRLYHGGPDLYYYMVSLLDPHDLISLSFVNTLGHQLIYLAKHRNVWLDWWKHNLSEVILPVGRDREWVIKEVLWYDLIERPRWIHRSRDSRVIMSNLRSATTKGYERYLRRNKLTPNHRDEILTLAVSANHIHIVTWLVESNVVASNIGAYAIERTIGQFDLWTLLIKNGLDVHISNGLMLKSAAKCGNNLFIGLLIDHGLDLTKRETQDALNRAVEHNHIETVKLLLERGVIPSKQYKTYTLISGGKNNPIYKLIFSIP